MSPKEIHEEFMETVGKEPPSYSTVKKWAAEFRTGRKSIEDDERYGALKRLSQMKTLSLWTVWSCMTGGETCEI